MGSLSEHRSIFSMEKNILNTNINRQAARLLMVIEHVAQRGCIDTVAANALMSVADDVALMAEFASVLSSFEAVGGAE